MQEEKKVLVVSDGTIPDRYIENSLQEECGGYNLNPSNVKIDKARLILFDVDHLLYICCPNKKLYKSNGQPKLGEDGKQLIENKTFEETCKLADQYIKSVFQLTKADYYIGALTKSKCFRYDLKKDYKINRVNVVKPPYFKEVLNYIQEKYKFVDFTGLEADDIVLICKKYYSKDYECIIVSTDKDLKMLVGTTFDGKKREWTTTNKEDAYNFFFSSLIVGDSADGIKALPGKGIKFAEKLFSTLKPEEYPGAILNEYIKYFGEEKGIEEFYVNYKVLRMIELPPEGFEIPSVIKVSYE